MSVQTKSQITPEEYLALERSASHKSEYFDGHIFAMAGASPRHVLITTNVVSELRGQLKTTPCMVYAVDLRVKISHTGLYTYPDIVVTCDTPQFDDAQKDTLLNPLLIVEILSESTKDYDRGEKFEHYRTLSSFSEYILIAQHKPHVEHFVRQPDNRWLLWETNLMQDTVKLVSVECSLALTEIYHKVIEGI